MHPSNLHGHATLTNSGSHSLAGSRERTTPKLSDWLLESFVNSAEAYARKTREQPSSHEILDKLTKSSHAEDITLAKNAVSHTKTQPSTTIPTWAEKVRGEGLPPYPPMPSTSSPTTTSSKEKDVVAKLDSSESATTTIEDPRRDTQEDKLNIAAINLRE